jgi:AAA domain-containing protein
MAATPKRSQKRSPRKPAAPRKRRPVAPKVDSERVDTVKAKKITWLMEGRIPAGMVTLVAGRPGQGKSLFSAWLAAEVSKKGTVIFSNEEDLRAEVSRPRLEAAGAKLERIHFWKPDVETKEGLAQLEQFIKAMDVKLMVLDPIAAHVRASIYNDQEIRRVLSPLGKVLERTGCSCVIVAHTTKRIAKSGHPLEAIGGSGGGLAGAARVIYVFGLNPDDPDERVLASVKANVLKPVSMAFEVDEHEVKVGGTGNSTVPKLVLVNDDCKVSARKVLSDAGGEASQAHGNAVKRAVAAEWLTSYLMFGARPANDVREDGARSGFSWGTIRRAADDLVISKRRKGFGPKSHVEWSLPDQHPALIVGQQAKDAVGKQIEDGSVIPGQLTVEDVLRMIDAGKDGSDNGKKRGKGGKR